MSQTATDLIKRAAYHGLVAADVARHLVEQVRNASEPERLAEHLLVLGGHCSSERITQLRSEIARQEATSVSPPAMVGGFQLLERLGSGGMGEVFRANQISMHRTVAIKLLKPELLRDAKLGERFLREARAAGAVNHPHVICCYDVGIADDRYFMALEYAGGGDAERLMHAYDHRLGEQRAVEIARDCARGLEALHTAGFVHRDIKPSNILLGEDGMAKVGDLGLVASIVSDQHLTQSGAALGTPAYMSPEQADGARDLDVRTDVYSLGASLFYLLTGHQPYTGQSAWAVVAKVINEPFPDPRRLNPEVSAACAAVVLRATAKERSERYQSARELLLALDDLLTGQDSDRPVAPTALPTSILGPIAAQIVHGPIARSTRRWLTPTLLAFGAVIITVPSAVLLFSTTPPPTPAEPAPVQASPVQASPVQAALVLPPAPPIAAAPAPVRAMPPAIVESREPVPASPTIAPSPWLQQPASAPVIAAAPKPESAVPTHKAAPQPAAAAPVAPPVVAVLGCEAGDATLFEFAKAFPELLTVALTRKGSFDLVERTQLRQVLTEQELTQSGVIDSSNAARIGQLAGARVLITQRVYSTGNVLYVSAKVIDVQSGRVKAVSRGELKKTAGPAVIAAAIATELGKAIDALSGATPSEKDETAALIKKLIVAVHGKRLPTVVIAVEETHLRLPAPDPAVRTELGFLLRKSGFRVVESDSPALAAWAKDYAAGRTSPFPPDLGAVEVVIVGGGVSETAGAIGAMSSVRARLELSAIAVGSGHLLAVDRATASAADTSETLAGKTALEKTVRQVALSFLTDLVTAWNER